MRVSFKTTLYELFKQSYKKWECRDIYWIMSESHCSTNDVEGFLRITVILLYQHPEVVLLFCMNNWEANAHHIIC